MVAIKGGFNVGATGIVRKIDNVGRITIPVEMMKSLGINNSDSIEFLIFTNGYLLLRRYEPNIITLKLTEDDISKNLDKIDEVIRLLNNAKELYKTYLGVG